MDLTPLLNLIPPPWNMVAIFALGVLAKWWHGRLNQPAPAPGPTPAPEPSNTPLLDAILAALRARLGRPAPTAQDIHPEKVGQLLALLGEDKPK